MSGTPKNGTRPKLWFQFLSSDFLPPQEICLFQSRFRSLEGFSITLHKQAKSTVTQILGTFSLGWLLANTRDVEETTLGSELWAWAGGPGRPNCLPGWMGKGRIEWHSFFFSQLFLVARYDVFLLDNIIPFCICLTISLPVTVAHSGNDSQWTK